MNSNYLVLALLLAFTSNLVAGALGPCGKNKGSCDRRRGLCWETTEGETTHFCTCKAGYKPLKNLRRHKCVDVNECEEEDVCNENAVCQNTRGSYICQCKCGYIKDYTGQRCLDARHISGRCFFPTSCYHLFLWWKRPVPFHWRYAELGYVTDTESHAFPRAERKKTKKKCSCESGFRRNYCGYCEDINECAEFTYKCTGTGSKCVNTEGSYYCECQTGYNLGPCKTHCYAENQEMPIICHQRNVRFQSSLARILTSSMPIPFILRNFQTCPEGVKPGNTTVQSFDLDDNGKNDVTLMWVCAFGGRSVLLNYAEDEAKWDQWSCWSSCKPTCWGGLQTRTRTCLHGLPGLKGCKGKGSETRECYTGPKCPYKIRKDAKALTDEEARDLVQAMRRYKKDMTDRGFHNAASAHGWPYQCDGNICCPHGAKIKFLAWHRTITLNYEQGISRFLHNKSIGIPYWNWLAKDRAAPSIAWSEYIFGDKNPFSNMTVRLDLKGPMRTVQRGNNANMDLLNLAEQTWRDVAKRLIKTYSMHEFAQSLEQSHNYPHVSVCSDGSERCKISMASIPYAGFDPIFMLHHSQIDRLWAVAQKKIADTGVTTWTMQTALVASEERGNFGRRQMPFGNKTLNSFPIVQAVNSIRDAYYQKELTGVIYDHLGNDGYPTNNMLLFAARMGARIGVAEVLFVAHYLRSISGTHPVYVNYYLVGKAGTCSQMTRSGQRIGGNILLPTKRKYNATVPSLIPIRMSRRSFSENYNVIACYTNLPHCTLNCSAATNAGLDKLPSPGLVHYLPNQPVDVFKFNWSPGKRMPNWNIDLKSGSQWLYFYGDGTGSIYQVATPGEWAKCNAKSGTPFKCSIAHGRKPCMLPVGIYYLVDKNEALCRRGLRMIITSKI